MALSLLFSRRHGKHDKANQCSLRKHGVRLILEPLEDRTLPAVTVPQLFVADIYFTEFGESRPAAEIANIASELLPGFTPTDLANQILSTTTFQAAEIRQLYAKFSGITPGSDGISFWLDFLAQPGNTMDTVRIDFLSSDAYYNRAGGTNTAFVSALFSDVWSQPVDATLLNQFVNQLNNGTSRKAVVGAFVTDPRGYRAQVVADYEMALDRKPRDPQDSISLSFFTSFRQNGGSNEQVLAQLHGSSELMKHMQFYLSQHSFSEPNVAAQVFRSQLKDQIAKQQAAEVNAVNAANQAKLDAMDAAQQVQNALNNSMGPAEQTPTTVDTGDLQEDAADAAIDAQQDVTDAKKQVQNAQTALDSAEPTSTIMQAVMDATAAEAEAQRNANETQMAATATQSCGTSTDLASYLMCLDSTAMSFITGINSMTGAHVTPVDSAKAQADILAEAAADDALPEPSPQNDTDNANDVDTVMPNMNAQDLANTALSAVRMAQMHTHYSAGSQAALLIDQAMAEAQAAQTAAGFCAAFANDADMDRNTVGQKAMDTHTHADNTHVAVGNALNELTQLENFNFFLDPLGFITLFNQFFADNSDYNTAVKEETLATNAYNDAFGYLENNSFQQYPRNVLDDMNSAGTQLTNAQTHLNNAGSDIMQAAQAAQAAANSNPDHEGDNNSGNRKGGNHVG